MKTMMFIVLVTFLGLAACTDSNVPNGPNDQTNKRDSCYYSNILYEHGESSKAFEVKQDGTYVPNLIDCAISIVNTNGVYFDDIYECSILHDKEWFTVTYMGLEQYAIDSSLIINRFKWFITLNKPNTTGSSIYIEIKYALKINGEHEKITHPVKIRVDPV